MHIFRQKIQTNAMTTTAKKTPVKKTVKTVKKAVKKTTTTVKRVASDAAKTAVTGDLIKDEKKAACAMCNRMKCNAEKKAKKYGSAKTRKSTERMFERLNLVNSDLNEIMEDCAATVRRFRKK